MSTGDYRFDPDWAPEEQRHLDEEYISWREDQADRERDERALDPVVTKGRAISDPNGHAEVPHILTSRDYAPKVPEGPVEVSRGAF